MKPELAAVLKGNAEVLFHLKAISSLLSGSLLRTTLLRSIKTWATNERSELAVFILPADILPEQRAVGSKSNIILDTP